MEKYKKIEVEFHGDVGILRLNDPDKLNAFSLVMFDEIMAAFDVLERSSRALILTGAGRGFCSGAGLDGGLGPSEPDRNKRDLGLVLEQHVNPIMSRLRNFSVPWISAVRGAAAGAGASLALAADMVVASETAYFMQSFSRLGLVPDGGATHLLTRSLSRVRAMELMLLGGKLPAQRALEWGLVNRVVADDKLEYEAMALATTLANGATVALGMIRKAAWEAMDNDWVFALQNERTLQVTAGRTEDFDEGITAFLEKRTVSFKGR